MSHEIHTLILILLPSPSDTSHHMKEAVSTHRDIDSCSIDTYIISVLVGIISCYAA
jgi:hypothetical protein